MLKRISQFTGRHYETGSVHNALALQGVKAPHTKKPFSEAFLLGVSGGIVFGYFTFEYKGHLPHVAILTRNTFDPFQTMLERLGVEQQVIQTTRAETAEKNLAEALALGNPVLVWVDECSLQPFRLPMDVLTQARARVKDDKFRLVNLASPLTSKLVPATQKGIWQSSSMRRPCCSKRNRSTMRPGNSGLVMPNGWRLQMRFYPLVCRPFMRPRPCY